MKTDIILFLEGKRIEEIPVVCQPWTLWVWILQGQKRIPAFEKISFIWRWSNNKVNKYHVVISALKKKSEALNEH